MWKPIFFLALASVFITIYTVFHPSKFVGEAYKVPEQLVFPSRDEVRYGFKSAMRLRSAKNAYITACFYDFGILISLTLFFQTAAREINAKGVSLFALTYFFADLLETGLSLLILQGNYLSSIWVVDLFRYANLLKFGSMGIASALLVIAMFQRSI